MHKTQVLPIPVFPPKRRVTHYPFPITGSVQNQETLDLGAASAEEMEAWQASFLRAGVYPINEVQRRVIALEGEAPFAIYMLICPPFCPPAYLLSCVAPCTHLAAAQGQMPLSCRTHNTPYPNFSTPEFGCGYAG